MAAIFRQLRGKIQWKICQSRSDMSTASTALKLPTNLQFHKATCRNQWSCNVDPEKVLVLFFPWFGAKEKTYKKYRELYLSRGVDVLTVAPAWARHMWLPDADNLGQQIQEAIDQHGQQYEHILLHAISVGGYLLNNVRLFTDQRGDKGGIFPRCRGVIYDSVIIDPRKVGTAESGAQNMEEATAMDLTEKLLGGLGISASKNRAVQTLVKYGWYLYTFYWTKKMTLDYAYNGMMYYNENPLVVPTLFYASRVDQFEEGFNVQQLAKQWRSEKNIPVVTKVWEETGHAMHLVKHRAEYVDTLDHFVSSVFDQIQEPRDFAGVPNGKRIHSVRHE